MDQHLIFLCFGLANGAVYAALALALVVTYRSSGVVNFSTGAIAVIGAYQYAFLRKGEFLVLLPFLPNTITLGGDLYFLPAVLVSVGMSALIGLLLYLCVFRPLRGFSPVAQAVASVGVMIVLTGLLVVRVGTAGVQAEPILPTDAWKVAGVLITSDRVWFAVVVVAVALVLTALFRFTPFGLQTRAAADSERGAYVSGIDPDRIAAVNWMISAAVAALAGILIAPIVPLTPDRFTLLIVPALAAAVLGQFQHMLVAVFGGLAIGMAQSDLTYLKGQHDWLPSSGRDELVVLVLVLVVLVIRAKPLPSRGALVRSPLGRAPRPRSITWPAILGTAAGLVGIFVLTGDWRTSLITSFIFSIIALSLVVVTGYAGQVSLAQLTLAGVAGFALGTLTTSWGVPFPIAPLLAALLSAVVGVLVGLPALRVRGLPVAVVTLATAVALEGVWFHNSDYVGVTGMDIEGPRLFGLDLRSRVGFDFPRAEFGVVVLLVLVAVAIGVARLRTSTLGSQMLAVRANERAAAAAGVAVVRVKIAAFAIGSFIAGLGGSMLGYFQANVTWVSFTALLGLSVFAAAYFAGITSVSGGILAGFLSLGGLVSVGLDRAVNVGDWYSILAGIGLVATVVLNPEGAVGPVHARIEKRRRASLPANVGDLAAATQAGDLVALPPATGGPVVLSAREINVRYGGVVAVEDATIEVRQGTIVALIGPNGAGKTSALDALSGFTPSRGAVELDGEPLGRLTPYRRVRAGLGRTFQRTELYDDMTVTENIVVGAVAARGRSPRTVEDTLQLLGLTAVADRAVSELSQGLRQLVSIGRALIGNPRVLLLDEPAGGLDSAESQWLGLRLRTIRDSGTSILLVDHDMHLVLNLCDDIYVLDFGKVIAHGPPTTIRADRTVAAAYLGEKHSSQEVAP